MKKVLFATTALVASAGIASAEVSVSGFAELGIFDNDVETQFHTDIDATFTMSGETDGGLTFGASIDIDETDGDRSSSSVFAATNPTIGDSKAFSSNTQGGETIFISGGFGTLTMGDTDGAFDAALTEAIIGGSIADDHEHAGYNGNAGFDGAGDGQVARYDYSFGDLGFHLSLEQIADGAGVVGAGDLVTGLGLTYSTSLGGVDLGLGLGYQECDNCDVTGVSVDASFAGGLRAILNFSSSDTAGVTTDHTGLALGYTMDALTVAANWGEFDTDGSPSVDGLGFIVNYDLGGGAEVQFGYGDSDIKTTWSLGLALSF